MVIIIIAVAAINSGKLLAPVAKNVLNQYSATTTSASSWNRHAGLQGAQLYIVNKTINKQNKQKGWGARRGVQKGMVWYIIEVKCYMC